MRRGFVSATVLPSHLCLSSPSSPQPSLFAAPSRVPTCFPRVPSYPPPAPTLLSRGHNGRGGSNLPHNPPRAPCPPGDAAAIVRPPHLWHAPTRGRGVCVRERGGLRPGWSTRGGCLNGCAVYGFLVGIPPHRSCGQASWECPGGSLCGEPSEERH